jgi:hypothetical protein
MTRYCTNCGEAGTLAFCSNCGGALGEVSPTAKAGAVNTIPQLFTSPAQPVKTKSKTGWIFAGAAAVAVAALLIVTYATVVPEATPVPSPTPTIAVGPVVLSQEEAGLYYLSVVCQWNFAGDAENSALAAGERVFFDGGEPDLTALKAAATESSRLTRLAVEVLDDPYFIWPEAVAGQIVHIRSAMVGELSPLNTVANATRFEDGYYAPFPALTPEQASAGQEIRLQLNLDTNALTSCAGYETALDETHAEMTARNDYLTEFASQEE